MRTLLYRASALFLALILAITPAIASEMPSDPIVPDPIISEETATAPAEETSQEPVDTGEDMTQQPVEEAPGEEPEESVVLPGEEASNEEPPSEEAASEETPAEQPDKEAETPVEEPEAPAEPPAQEVQEVPVVPEVPPIPPKKEPLPPIVLTEADVIEEFKMKNPLHADRNGSIQYEAGSTVDFFFPETIGGTEVRSISNWAFFGNEVFSTVVIPACITKIGNFAFGNCPNLKYIILMDRSDTSGMTLGKRWYGDAEVVFTITIPEQPEELPEIKQEELPVIEQEELPEIEQKLPEIIQQEPKEDAVEVIDQAPISEETKQEEPAKTPVETEKEFEIVSEEPAPEDSESDVESGEVENTSLSDNKESAAVPKQEDTILREIEKITKDEDIAEDLL